MKNLICAARNLVEKGSSNAKFADFEQLAHALQEFDKQRAKHADIQRIKILRPVHKKAKYPDNRVFDAEFAPGDTATVIGNNFENIRCVSDDPARVQFSLSLVEEGKTWEYYIKRGAE